MHTAYLALGTNVGDRQAHLNRAVAAIATLPGIAGLRLSRVRETAPVGPQDQGAFLNAAVAVQTWLAPQALLADLLNLETRLGRPTRANRRHWGPREIDLDLLVHGPHIINTPALVLPHPRLHERSFVLDPLNDLAAHLIIPGQPHTVAQLLADLSSSTP
ncbi:MAG: 2-amino-4-hydroxy-6-hydroxymethyldihydropteridine diphosphokinase [Algisphaera sp.]